LEMEIRMSLSVKLDAFDGPLDLLLHLIEKNKIDIFDIPIAEITEQYMDYVAKMDSKDMDVMSDFLLMAANLLRIKSQMLLPVLKNEEGEEEDPRAELVERLLEYKVYKYASLELKDKQMDASRLLFKGASIPKEISHYREEIDVEKILGDVTLIKLQHVFDDVMRRQEEKIDPIRSKFGKIEKEAVSLPDQIQYVQSYAKEHRCFRFRELLEQQPDKLTLIVTFLSILELMKVGCLAIQQETAFSDFEIQWVEGGSLIPKEFTISSME
jgi:segregation and condensation protein A